MKIPVDFEWDEAKAASNLRKHRVPFHAAIGIFADLEHVVIDAVREEDGERRKKIVGMMQGRVFTAVFVMRGDTCRWISVRRSNAREERLYAQG